MPGDFAVDLALGHFGVATACAEELAPVLHTARETVPYAECSVVLLSVCALLDRGDHVEAERRAEAKSPLCPKRKSCKL